MAELYDNIADSRYELSVGAHTVFARYERRNGVLVLLWVEAPPALRGTGAADTLMALIAAEARERGWRLQPVCSYAAAWLRRNPQSGGMPA
jgi:predicted GNAT family acetyltransferase